MATKRPNLKRWRFQLGCWSTLVPFENLVDSAVSMDIYKWGYARSQAAMLSIRSYTPNKIKCFNMCWFGSRKWFWLLSPQAFTMFAVAGNMPGHAIYPAEKSIINMIWLLFSVFDWSIIMISPGGLLLVVPHVVAVLVSVWWAGLQKSKLTKTWMWKIFV